MCKTYDVINQRIMELLEQGTIPWKKPWNAQSNYPKNIISGKKYQGVNVFMLACSEFSSPYWMTFKQCQDKGGHVIKGSKSTPVIFWKWLDRKDAPTEGDNSSNGKIPMLRFYSVFNIEQTEGITPPTAEETHNIFDPLTRAEEIIAAMPMKPEIKHGGGRAYYSPTLDYVQLSHQHTFDTIEHYYNTLFHELSHATGHSNRLGRKGVTETSYFGSHEYSKEELVAEMGAAFLCGHAGIENTTIENSAAYIQGWLKALKNDKTLLVHAAAQAQKASDYVLNVKPDVVEEVG
ncbi:MAG: zincin-like metallopeptidase domain-containing protein [Desulfuromonadaceae bacterium]|nr:zincin-like metallopeptidase domain-containing protein [Desulfuromonadaceae bacterium]MDD2847615.1 zincin-like metallopeptidase domain-containing protein [Desulfuromonadaceae bacterium]MDD4131139.1 zincin-like metallopeptidase domain-containing protein [Desulfuromonadaceae bacterium]